MRANRLPIILQPIPCRLIFNKPPCAAKNRIKESTKYTLVIPIHVFILCITVCKDGVTDSVFTKYLINRYDENTIPIHERMNTYIL